MGYPEGYIGIKVWDLGFPKIRGTILGVPIIRNYRIFGSISRSPHFGKLPYLSLQNPHMSYCLNS